MCNGECDRLFIEDGTFLYCCGFWSGHDEVVAIDSVPSESFDKNGKCKFFEKEEQLSAKDIIDKLKSLKGEQENESNI